MIVKENKLPDFLIIGAAKSGTTSLYHYLRKHPDVYFAEPKECFFFCFKDNPPNYNGPDKLKNLITDYHTYVRQFENVPDSKIIGDDCPYYLPYSNVTISNIKEVYGEHYNKIKIIIILRNPVDRAYSHWSMQVKDHFETLSFKKGINEKTIKSRRENNWNIAFDYISLGMYYNQVKPFVDTFSDVKLFTFDELRNDKSKMLKEICTFLNIKSLDLDDDNIYNISYIPQVKWLDRLLTTNNRYKETAKKILRLFISEAQMKKIASLLRERNRQKGHIPIKYKLKLYALFEEDIKKTEKITGLDLKKWRLEN